VARPTAIPPNLEGEILKKFGESWSSRRISEWLKTEHAVTASHNAVAKFLAKHREERADVAKAIVREKLGQTVTSDIDELEAARKRAREIEAEAMVGEVVMRNGKPVMVDGKPLRIPDHELALKAIKLETDILDKKLHYSGAGEPDAAATQSLGVVVLPAEEPE
jgi:hypothetical protein